MADRTSGDFSHRNCTACQRLWREYADANTMHIKLTGKQQIAALQYDHAAAASLENQVADADRARRAAREAIAHHEAEHKD